MSENILFSYSPDQKWYYVSDQSDEEVWLIKTMDSLARSEDIAMCKCRASFEMCAYDGRYAAYFIL